MTITTLNCWMVTVDPFMASATREFVFFFLDVTLFIHYIVLITESVNHLTRDRGVRSYSPQSIWSVFYK